VGEGEGEHRPDSKRGEGGGHASPTTGKKRQKRFGLFRGIDFQHVVGGGLELPPRHLNARNLSKKDPVASEERSWQNKIGAATSSLIEPTSSVGQRRRMVPGKTPPRKLTSRAFRTASTGLSGGGTPRFRRGCGEPSGLGGMGLGSRGPFSVMPPPPRSMHGTGTYTGATGGRPAQRHGAEG